MLSRWEADNKDTSILSQPRAFAKKYLDIDLWQIQEDRLNLALKTQILKLLVLDPVDHGKSWALGYIYPLMRIIKDRNWQLLFGTASPILKKVTSKRIRDQLRYNDKIIEDFGVFYHPDNIWESDKFSVIRSDKNIRDPTFTAVTTGQAIEGIKADEGLLDDFVDIDSSTSEAKRISDMHWYDTTFMNRLKPTAPVKIDGTRWHPEDAYNTIIERGSFEVLTYTAISSDWDPKTVLCPERWSVELLRQRRTDIGERAFDQKFFNNPHAMVGVRLDPDWLNYYDRTPKTERRVMFIDPASGKSTKQSFYARAIGGLAEIQGDWRIYILDTFRDHIKFPDQIKDIETAYNTWDPELVIVESNFDGGALYQWLVKKRMMNIAEHHEGRNKLAKIEAHGPFFKNEIVWIRRDMFDFIHEFTNFPGAHQDLLDCVCGVIDHFAGSLKGKIDRISTRGYYDRIKKEQHPRSRVKTAKGVKPTGVIVR